MTDEEALAADRHEWCCRCRDLGGKFPSVNEADAYAAGYRAGLARARTWRPLTEDPERWPEEGALVAVADAERKWATPDANANAVHWSSRVAVYGWTHYLLLPPLPDPTRGT